MPTSHEVTTRVGVDVQSVAEIERSLDLFGFRYLERVYDEVECNYALSHPRTAPVFLAGRFAAREAVLKLLEAPDVLVVWDDIAIGELLEVSVRGEALKMSLAHGMGDIHLSLSACRGTVTAVAVADTSSWRAV